jgi:RNA polymerase sigma factor (sigma-70 family)
MKNVTEAILQQAEVLTSYARKLTRNSDAAKDLCQETMFRALANRARVRQENDVRPWLYTIMRNLFINSCRKKQVERRLFISNPTEMGGYPDPSTHAFMIDQIELKEIQWLIHEMPETLRIPISLYWQGYKYQEIAAITDTVLGTTKSRIFMARQLLRGDK